MDTRLSRTQRRVYIQAVLARQLAISLLADILSVPLQANTVRQMVW